MIGQTKLNERLKKLTVDTLPNALLLVGDFGCGKHIFVTELANKLNLRVVDISENINDDTIFDIQSSIENIIYTIDSNKISEKSQNVLLKILEEPVAYAHFIILCEGITGILPTILNRCNVWKFESYTIDDLKQIVNMSNPELYNIFNTPGKLLIANTLNAISYIEDAEKIFKFIDCALISNILILPKKLYYKEIEENKLSFDLFVDILVYMALKLYKEGIIGFNAFLLTNALVTDSKIFSIDKQKLYERYLIELKDDLRKFKNGNRI